MSSFLFPRAVFLAFVFILLVDTASVGQSLKCMGPSASDNPAAREEVDHGVVDYKNSRYADAILHFQKATNLSPCMTMARSYLATAQAQNVVPALSTPDNLKTADQAIGNFQLVLAQEPHDLNSLKQIAGVYLNTNRIDEARDWQKKVLAEDPRDAEAAYTIGVIDWRKAHTNTLKALESVKLMDDGEGNSAAPPETLAAIKSQNSYLLSEALQYLSLAIAEQPNYDDAMDYLNLVYRRKADIDYDNPALREEDVATAKEWTKKALLTRKENKGQNAASPDQPAPR